MPKVKIVQIQAVRYTNFFSKHDNIALFGVGENGVVYQYEFDAQPESWRPLRMMEKVR